MCVSGAGRGATREGATTRRCARFDAASRASVRYAVIVLRDEDKAAARAHFKTPLVFSVRVAHGSRINLNRIRRIFQPFASRTENTRAS